MKTSQYFQIGCGTVIVAFIFCIFLCAVTPSVDLGTVLCVLGLLIIAIIIAIIFSIMGTVKAIKEFYVFTRDAVIGLFTIKREVRLKCPNAIKALILEKEKHSVTVGVFDTYSSKYTEKITISGNGEVDNSINVGQLITLEV